LKIKNRQQLLTIAAIVVVGLFAADKVVITPLGHLWSERSKQISTLRKKVEDGRQLIRRDAGLRSRWSQMQTNTLPNNESLAEQQILKALDRWAQESRVSMTSFGHQLKHDSEDFMTVQCRVEASGTMERVSQFLYDLEKDPMALKLEAVEISSRDNEGQQLSLGLQISGLVLTPPSH
jgi:Tfp pilus assembly protein PilO